MSLFQFGFSLSREEPSPEDSVEVEILESHIPMQEDTNLGVVEHRETAAAVVNLSRPAEISQPNQHPKRKRGKYFQYNGEDRVKIGKFASENGNKKTLERFIEEFPGLKESTVRAFKKAFREELSAQTRQGNVQLVTSLETQKRGRPPFLLELDSKLIAFLKNLRSRGGVVNGSVVSAAALTVNGQAKKFCKNKFATWYSAEVQKQVDSGINFEDVDVDLKLSVLKPIHATWLVELYNFFTSTEGKVYVLKGWEKAGIKDVLNGKEVLPPVDPYQDIYAND